MTEAGDFDPGPWKGYDFKSARNAYDTGRSYRDTNGDPARTLEDLLPLTISTESTSPLVLMCDNTGSMGEWPGIIIDKFGYLEHEAKEYMGPGTEICVGVFGDAYAGDEYPVQARPFASGIELAERLLELIIEGGGGGQTMENSELAAIYLARNVHMPNAIRPICIFVSDESPYDFVDKEQAREYAHVGFEGRMSTKGAFEELKKKFAVYLVRKPYETTGKNKMSDIDLRIYRTWVELLGEDHVYDLPEPGRVVDVIFAILARECGRMDDFKKELEERQTRKQVLTVYKAIPTVHELPAGIAKPNGSAGRSVTKRLARGKGKNDPLI